MKLHYGIKGSLTYSFACLIYFMISNYEATGNTFDGCNAEFAVGLDTTGTFPIYTFTALETNSSKTYSWNIGGGLLRTGREIDHIFFDA
ncbi:MAG: hypothetical protein AAF519_19075, partial [Bacteroidota bacterium]